MNYIATRSTAVDRVSLMLQFAIIESMKLVVTFIIIIYNFC